MKAEINNENKAKFFALYWGQKVFSDSLGFKVHGLDVLRLSWLENNIANLKPLSSISDEDGLKLYKIVNPNGWINKEPKYIRTWLNSFHSAEHKNLPPFAVDFIRSIGVAFDWMGLSVDDMVQAGWIKLI